MKKEIPTAGFFPRGVFPPQNKMGENPRRVFYPKIILSYFSSNKHYTLCVQSSEWFLSKKRDFNFSLR